MEPKQLVFIFFAYKVLMSAQATRFLLLTGPNRGMLPLMAGWPEISVISCAVACETLDGCYNFSYNQSTRLCTPGSYVKSTLDGGLSAEDDLYTKDWHETNGDVELIAILESGQYLLLSVDAKNYTDAAKSCEDNQANLVTIKDIDKMEKIRNVSVSKNFWVGLNDMEEEGVFLWVDDGSRIDPVVANFIFRHDEPNNGGSRSPNEDCVEYVINTNDLNDKGCESRINYVCEAYPV